MSRSRLLVKTKHESNGSGGSLADSRGSVQSMDSAANKSVSGRFQFIPGSTEDLVSPQSIVPMSVRLLYSIQDFGRMFGHVPLRLNRIALECPIKANRSAEYDGLILVLFIVCRDTTASVISTLARLAPKSFV